MFTPVTHSESSILDELKTSRGSAIHDDGRPVPGEDHWGARAGALYDARLVGSSLDAWAKSERRRKGIKRQALRSEVLVLVATCCDYCGCGSRPGARFTLVIRLTFLAIYSVHFSVQGRWVAQDPVAQYRSGVQDSSVLTHTHSRRINTNYIIQIRQSIL